MTQKSIIVAFYICIFLNSEECQTVSNALAVSRAAMYVGSPWSSCSSVSSVTISDAIVGDKPWENPNCSLFYFLLATSSSLSAMICSIFYSTKM